MNCVCVCVCVCVFVCVWLFVSPIFLSQCEGLVWIGVSVCLCVCVCLCWKECVCVSVLSALFVLYCLWGEGVLWMGNIISFSSHYSLRFNINTLCMPSPLLIAHHDMTLKGSPVEGTNSFLIIT